MGDIHLFSSINQSLLNRRNALLLFDPLFDLRHFVVRLNIELDFLSREGADSIHSLARLRQVVVGWYGVLDEHFERFGSGFARIVIWIKVEGDPWKKVSWNSYVEDLEFEWLFPLTSCSGRGSGNNSWHISRYGLIWHFSITYNLFWFSFFQQCVLFGFHWRWLIGKGT